MVNILQTTFLNAFPDRKLLNLIQFQWIVFRYMASLGLNELIVSMDMGVGYPNYFGPSIIIPVFHW